MPKFIAIDTEFTTEHLPYYVSTCDQDGDINSWEFPVSPQGKPKIPSSFAKEFARVIRNKTPVFHNAKADLPVLANIGFDLLKDTTLGIYSPTFEPAGGWCRSTCLEHLPIHDTMIASHLWKSSGSHKLKDLAWELIDFGISDETDLLKVIKQARGLVQRHPEELPYKIFRPEHATESGDGQQWMKFDSWLPGALVRNNLQTLHRLGLDQFELNSFASALSSYGNADAERTMGLWLFYLEAFDSYHDPDNGLNYWGRYWEAMQIIPCILDMESRGVTLNWKNLTHEREHYASEVSQGRTQALAAINNPPDFNPNSDHQVRKVLFDEWNLPVLAKTEGGKPSVKAAVLERLLSHVEEYQKTLPATVGKLPLTGAETKRAIAFLQGLLRMNTATTALSYLDGYKDAAFLPDADESSYAAPTVYPSYNPIGTATCRFSSSSPNITNVGKGEEYDDFDEDGNPIKKKDFQLRKCFGPAPGRIWFAIDYQQLQLVIFAHMAQDADLLSAFAAGIDIHDFVARKMYGKGPTDPVSKIERRNAKAVNFGIIFGIGDQKLNATSGVPGLGELFRSQFPSVGPYMRSVIQEVRKKGMVLTMGGYPLHVDRSRAYAGVNYIDQGTEGQLVKRAMIACRHHLLGTNDYLRFMVHDELVFDFEVRRSKKKSPAIRTYSQYEKLVLPLKTLMEEAARSVGVEARCSVSVIESNWADAVELDW